MTGGRLTGHIVKALLSEHFTVILSPQLLDELLTTLGRPIFQLTRADLDRVVNFLVLHARFVQPDHPVHACRDPKDNALLECALAAQPSCIVTGDRDLLILHPFHAIPIITPRRFIEEFLTV